MPRQPGLRSGEPLNVTARTRSPSPRTGGRVRGRTPRAPSLLAWLVVAGAAGTLAPRTAEAAPQASLGLEVGGGVTDLRAPDAPHGAFVLGGRGDVLFLRSRDKDFAIGPYVDVGTEAFSSLDLGAGAELLIPAIPSVPFVLGAGATERHTGPFGWETGLSTSLFFGPRGYNFHSWYGMANGLFVEGRYGLGDGKQCDVLFGARIDTMILAMPFLFLYEAVAH